MSTKSESFEAIQAAAPSIAAHILNTIAAYPGLSRGDIAEMEEIRIQTVCGAVNKLIKDRKVRVNGSYVDPQTKRRVEKLEAVPAFNVEEA